MNKSFLLGLIGILFFLFSNSRAGFTQTSLGNTEYFYFENNFWVNLHHYLYEKASGEQKKKLGEDGAEFIDIGEIDAFGSLNHKEKKALEQGINYYKQNIVEAPLMKLVELRGWLVKLPENKAIQDTTFSAEFAQILNSSGLVYKEYLWPLHSTQNQNVFNHYFELIRQFEGQIMPKMQALGGARWPNEKVRVDLVAYANWAGAYTPTEPTPNIFISTLDPISNTSGFIETVFHEGSHLIFTRKSMFRSRIFFMSQEMEIEFPSNLWHASLFFLCGKAVKEALFSLDINHTLLMNERNIFGEYDSPVFRATLEEYYQGRLDLEITIQSLLKEVSAR